MYSLCAVSFFIKFPNYLGNSEPSFFIIKSFSVNTLLHYANIIIFIIIIFKIKLNFLFKVNSDNVDFNLMFNSYIKMFFI